MNLYMKMKKLLLLMILMMIKNGRMMMKKIISKNDIKLEKHLKKKLIFEHMYKICLINYIYFLQKII